MKTTLFLLFAILTFQINSIAQDDCSSPAYLNLGLGVTSYSDSLNYNMSNWGANDSGCLGLPSAAYWLEFEICTSGNLLLDLSAMSSANDIDFIVFGPYSNPASCSFSSSDVVDCSFSTAAMETININGAQAGESYMLAISNYSDTSGVFMISLNGLSSASVCDTSCEVHMHYPELCYVQGDYQSGNNEVYWSKDPMFFGDYIIYRETTISGTYDSIGTVNYMDSAYFMDVNSNIQQQSYRYKVGARNDSCSHVELIGDPHSSIHLQTSTNMTTGDINLSWSGYQGTTVGQYYILRGASPSTLSIYDSVANTNTTYTDVSANFNAYYYAIGFASTQPCSYLKMNNVVIGNIVFEGATGLGEVLNQRDFKVYPNPSNGNVTIESAVVLRHINVFDLTGKSVVKIMNEDKQNIIPIDLSELRKGVYFVVGETTNGGKVQRKLVLD